MSTNPRSLYYLDNFCEALTWLKSRYADLLQESERAFIETLPALTKESAALLVRMLMRRGELFRTSKLRYTEIGSPERASEALVALSYCIDL